MSSCTRRDDPDADERDEDAVFVLRLFVREEEEQDEEEEEEEEKTKGTGGIESVIKEAHRGMMCNNNRVVLSLSLIHI